MPDRDWVYHLTRREIALIIKRGGMTTSLSRIGMPVPHPRGAFVQDRQKREGTECQEKLRDLLAHVLACGVAKETIEQKPGQYFPFTMFVQGSNEIDIPGLEGVESLYLERYKKLLPNVKPFNENKYFEYGTSVPVRSMANTMLIRDKNHYLTRLAVQLVSYRFKIEETITASHIYFLKPGDDAKSGYRDYRQHLGDANIVVLRVLKADIPDLIQDDSEGRAMMTARPVHPDLIQVMVNHDDFPKEDYRTDDKNWQPIANLV